MGKTDRLIELAESGGRPPGGPIDCACLIHGSVYGWDYVERLYNMLSRQMSAGIRLHVYTEHDRKVPAHMIKHELKDYKISGPRKAWWYKLQLFNHKHHQGPLLYFDLDTVITDRIDWITHQNLNYFWAPRDFKRLWRPNHQGINSSVMWWDTRKYQDIWQQFKQQDFALLQRRYPGDQDFLSDVITQDRRRFLDEKLIRSWKWECLDNGWDFKRRKYNNPGTGTRLDGAGVLIFHGKPNPAEVQDPVVLQHWK
jgi:hypothetical protein